MRYEGVSALPALAFAKWLTAPIKVAAIALSPFDVGAREQGIVPFCFAKQDATLELALAGRARL